MAVRGIGLLAVFLAFPALAQPLLSGYSDLRFRLDRLASDERVLMIGAHPDDELNSLLAHLATILRMRTAYLSLTRGEGGQNLIGAERGVVLGAMRAEESYAAGRLEHAERYFTSAVDFGYSKTAAEALAKWDREKTLGEIVAIIRELKPQTIISVWSGTASDGHGQHQAAGILAREAFSAAADPSRFPKAGQPWTAARYLLAPRQAQGAAGIETGVRDPVLGYSGAEIAAISRSRHRSQGQGELIQRASATDYLIGDLAGWRLKPPRGIPADPEHPEELIKRLFALRGTASDTREVDEVIALSAGVWLDARVPAREFVEGEAWPVTFEAIARGSVAVRSIRVIAGGTQYSLPPVPLRQPSQLQATMQAAPAVRFAVELPAGTIEVERPVVYRYDDLEWGERTAVPAVLPPVTLSFAEDVVLFTDGRPKAVTIKVRAARAAAGRVVIDKADGWTITPAEQQFRLEAAGQARQLQFTVTPPATNSKVALSAMATVDGKTVNVERVVLNYSHIPVRTVLVPATATFARADLRVAAKRVAYVPGAGDQVPEALRRIGIDVQVLDVSRLIAADLSGFDALVFGIRAFNVSPELSSAAEQVRHYAMQGGTVVVQYNTAGPGLTLPIAPFSLTLGSDRVSVEDAPVTPLDPAHRLWKFPNALSDSDFDGWVQERGLYFASRWDSQYKALISSRDPDEKPVTGALLYAPWGKGAFVYTGLSFFRQLPAGVPGAYRLFSNILSAGRHAP